ncbi:hypothetical protein QBC45DRAFT_413510 [Copromyces sp. CBS 386.78]|nr:hypothetical protein QBC45DRAFT_413510 [Copromyces sp. CBS 386.78]
MEEMIHKVALLLALLDAHSLTCPNVLTIIIFLTGVGTSSFLVLGQGLRVHYHHPTISRCSAQCSFRRFRFVPWWEWA